MMSRNDALRLIDEHVQNRNLRKHMLATEAVMGALAERLGEDRTAWAMAGLLHDLDYDETVKDPKRHGTRTVEMLAEYDLPEEVTQSILAHCGQRPCTSMMDRAIYASDPVTGLIVAATLMHPSRELKQLDPGFILKRFKEKRFAAGADRDQIRSCEELGLSLDEFVGVALKAMQETADDLGL
ncbi:MAG: HDIG domain-containing protein [Candidatus Eisenbacteria sp.]|nr:HDIG domain-containing protein [Candidatus Eisenbacteria bacterium]